MDSKKITNFQFSNNFQNLKNENLKTLSSWMWLNLYGCQQRLSSFWAVHPKSLKVFSCQDVQQKVILVLKVLKMGFQKAPLPQTRNW